MHRKRDLGLVAASGIFLCCLALELGHRLNAKGSTPVPVNQSANPWLAINGLKLFYQTGIQFDIDLTLHNYSPSVQLVLLPPEISIESIPKVRTIGHATEFEMTPSQESAYTWSAQVDHQAIGTLRKIMAEVMAGKKTVTIRTHFKDQLGHWYTERVLGRFSAGRFLILETPPAQASSPPR
jgi:hypothetical protein